jgi:hypothetical protein
MQPAPEQRRKIRVSGQESLVDVARVVFHDVRLAALMSDLNPTLPRAGALPAETVVVCPSKIEALAFAKKLGFTLGFDEKGSNGTRRRRAWAKLQGPGAPRPTDVDPVAAARQLLVTSLPPAEVAKRLVTMYPPEVLAPFVDGDVDVALRAVQQATLARLALPRARSRLHAIVGVIDATLRPEGLEALLRAFVDDRSAADAVLAAVLVPTSIRERCADRADAVITLVRRARELACLERGARDVTLRHDPQATALSPLVAAVVDRVAPVSGARLAPLGLDDVWTALEAQLRSVRELLKKHEALLARAGVDVLTTLARGGDGAHLPRSWAIVAAVVRGLSEPLTRASLTAQDRGLGGLVVGADDEPPRGDVVVAAARPTLLAANLQARAASGARVVDEGAAVAIRMAPTVCALLEMIRAVPADAGPASTRRARRRAHFDELVSAKGAPLGQAIARFVDEIIIEARRTRVVDVDRLSKAHTQAAVELARDWVGPVSVHKKNTSELARAVVIVAGAVDRELGALLLRPTGREAFRQALDRHGAQILSKASLLFSEARTSP